MKDTIEELKKERDFIYRQMTILQEKLATLPKSKKRNKIYADWEVLYSKATALSRRINFNSYISSKNITFKR